MLSEVDAMGITAILHLGLSLNVLPPPFPRSPSSDVGNGGGCGIRAQPRRCSPDVGSGSELLSARRPPGSL